MKEAWTLEVILAINLKEAANRIQNLEVKNQLFCDYTVLQNYAHIGAETKLLRAITLDIITRLLDNAVFVCIHVVGRFSEDFSELRGLRSRGFQLQG